MNAEIIYYSKDSYMRNDHRIETTRKSIMEILEDHECLTLREITQCLRIRNALRRGEKEYVLSQLIELHDAGEIEVVGKKNASTNGMWRIKRGGTKFDLSRYAEAAGRIGTEDRRTWCNGSGFAFNR